MDAPVARKHFSKRRELARTGCRATILRAILGEERMGSGVIVDDAGLILTVNYVVMGAQSVQVSFLKGRRQKAEVIAQDFETGLALVRVKRQGLRAALLAPTEQLERGTAVVTAASTGTQERRAGGGHVTYIGEFEAYWEYLLDRGIVSSAPNPGYGGGGLFDLAGRLLGILYLHLKRGWRGPRSRSRRHLPGARARAGPYGRVVSRPRRAWLGVFAHALEEGVVVAGVVPGGPGERAGIREGDLIGRFNAEEIGSRRDMSRGSGGTSRRALHIEVMRDTKVCASSVTGGGPRRILRHR